MADQAEYSWRGTPRETALLVISEVHCTTQTFQYLTGATDSLFIA